jgi:hypothetical protein
LDESIRTPDDIKAAWATEGESDKYAHALAHGVILESRHFGSKNK